MSLIRRSAQSVAETRSITSLPWLMEPARTDAGVTVTERTALQLSAVWACVSLITDLIASMPMDTYAKGRLGVPVAVQDQNLPNIVVSPSLRGLTRREWTAQALHGGLMRGNAFGVVVADRNGFADAAEWVAYDEMSVEEINSLAPPRYRLSGQSIPMDKVLHLRSNLVPGSVVGLSPIELQAQTLGIGLAAQKFGAQWFGQGAHPSALLTTEHPLKPEQADLMKVRWIAALKGKREPAVMGAGIKYTPVQVTPNESQFLETIQANVADIARIFKVPVELIGGAAEGSSVTYANREERGLDLLAFTIQPWMTKLEDLISGLLPPGMFVKFNVDAMLRVDLITRFQAHAIALQNHFETLDEVRALENRAPLNNGEQFAPEGTLQKFQPKTAK